MGAIHILHLGQTVGHHAVERRVCVGVELLTFKRLIHIHSEREHQLAVHDCAPLAIHINPRQDCLLCSGKFARAAAKTPPFSRHKLASNRLPALGQSRYIQFHIRVTFFGHLDLAALCFTLLILPRKSRDSASIHIHWHAEEHLPGTGGIAVCITEHSAERIRNIRSHGNIIYPRLAKSTLLHICAEADNLSR